MSAASLHLPRFRRGALALVVVPGLCSAVLGDQPVAELLRLDPARWIEQLRLWQPLSAALVYPEGAMGGLLLALALQWFVGSEVEARWGTRRYVTVVIACGLIGYLFAGILGAAWPAIAGVVLGGSLPWDMAAVAAYGTLHGRTPVRLLGAVSISSRALAAWILGLSLVPPVLRGAEPLSLVAPALAAAGAWVFVRAPWRRRGVSGKLRPGRSNGARLHVVPSDPDRLN